MIDVDLEQRVGNFALRARFVADAPVVGLFGRSGSGKSTLINAIAGVTKPERGHVRVDDVVLFDSAQRIDLPPQQRRVGYVFQDALLFPHLSVEANLLYGHRLRAPTVRFIEPAHVIDVLGLARAARTASPARFRAARSSASRSAARCSPSRASCCSTSRSPRSTSRAGWRSSTTSSACATSSRFPIVYVSHSVAEITRLADTLVVLSAGECVGVGDVDAVMGRLDLKPYTGRFEAGAVIEATVIAHDLDFDLTTLRFDGGELTVSGPQCVHRRAGSRAHPRPRRVARARQAGRAFHRQRDGGPRRPPSARSPDRSSTCRSPSASGADRADYAALPRPARHSRRVRSSMRWSRRCRSITAARVTRS